jgi:hypothetical protein
MGHKTQQILVVHYMGKKCGLLARLLMLCRRLWAMTMVAVAATRMMTVWEAAENVYWCRTLTQ